MKLCCPTCYRLFPTECVNIGRDVAYCPPCNEVFALSKLAGAAKAEPEIVLKRPPRGIRYEPRPDGMQITVRTASFWTLATVPLVFLFVGIGCAFFYGSLIQKRGFLIFFSLLMLLGCLSALHGLLMGLFGKMRVTIRGDAGKIFSGYFGIGNRQQFRLSEVTGVFEQTSADGEDSSTVLVIEGAKELYFGLELDPEQRWFVLRALRTAVEKSKQTLPPSACAVGFGN